MHTSVKPTTTERIVAFIRRLNHQRKRARDIARYCEQIPLRRGTVRRLALITGDPATVTGSKGDEAMLLSVLQHLAVHHPDVQVGVVTACSEAEGRVRRLGLEPIPVWHIQDPSACLIALDQFNADALWVLGADVIDGSYSASDAVRMVRLAQAYAQRRRCGAILGFSFSASPAPAVLADLRGTSRHLAFRARDPRSAERLRRKTGIRAKLVADLAFLLEPSIGSEATAEIADWIRQQRASGHVIVGLNVHPMLARAGAPGDLDDLVRLVVASLTPLLSARHISIVPIPHDDREPHGDHATLQAIVALLIQRFPEQIWQTDLHLSSADVKAVCGMLDGTVTGRMHLAIASLGMGTPVLAIAYQDKFEGLLDHFGLPQTTLVPSARLSQPDVFRLDLTRFLDELPELKRTVASRLPDVIRHARAGLARLI